MLNWHVLFWWPGTTRVERDDRFFKREAQAFRRAMLAAGWVCSDVMPNRSRKG